MDHIYDSGQSKTISPSNTGVILICVIRLRFLHNDEITERCISHNRASSLSNIWLHISWFIYILTIALNAYITQDDHLRLTCTLKHKGSSKVKVINTGTQRVTQKLLTEIHRYWGAYKIPKLGKQLKGKGHQINSCIRVFRERSMAISQFRHCLQLRSCNHAILEKELSP